MFGGFRSMAEAAFGDLVKTFKKFNNKEVVRTTCKKEFNLALRLCLLLMNVRNFARAMGIDEQTHHRAWMNDGVDYPREKRVMPELTEVVTVQNKLENGLELLELQKKFLGMEVVSDNEEMENEDGASCDEK
ncbi:hypothetical protein BGX28_001301 [Mortierella sp. GBA30]|nr:hypothetical protein BGX28_001301 [Mortierella sp. GBA30]